MMVREDTNLGENPIVERWALANVPADYKYSSAFFYEKNVKNFSFIKDMMNEF